MPLPLPSPFAAAPLVLLALSCLATSGMTGEIVATPHLGDARSWTYQLQAVVPAVIAARGADLTVIDFAQEGSTEAWGPAEVAQMRTRPDGSSRFLLAYLSIGEAEDYRWYWNPAWKVSPPRWLGRENPDWAGNYPVEFWDPDWQAIIFGASGAYLDRIIEAGFDGVYLDRVDAFDGAGRARRIPQMTDFVHRLADYARSRKPGFLVVAQNGEELLEDPEYAAVLDGLAKEDLFFGLEGDGVPNDKAEIRASLSYILPFIAAGKPVFLVEYLSDPADVAVARDHAAQLPAPLLIARRELNHVN